MLFFWNCVAFVCTSQSVHGGDANIPRDNDERLRVSGTCRAFGFEKAVLIDLASSHHSLQYEALLFSCQGHCFSPYTASASLPSSVYREFRDKKWLEKLLNVASNVATHIKPNLWMG
jgi:hypothetical protein